MKEARDLFKMMDYNDNGFLTPTDMIAYWKTKNYTGGTETQARNYLTPMDKNGDDRVSWQEYWQWRRANQ